MMGEIINSLAAPAPREGTFEPPYSNSLAILPRHIEEKIDIYSTHELLKYDPL